MPGILSNYLSKARSKKIIPFLKGNVLDIGCGQAANYRLSKELDLPIQSYTGIEYDPKRIKSLKIEFPEAKFFAVDLDKEEIPKEKQYDTILLLAVVEHIFNLKFLFEQIYDLLEDGGVVVITTPSPFGNDFVHKIGTMLGLFDKEGGQEDHIVIFNKKRLQILANEVGLVVDKYQRFQLGCNQLAVFKKV